MAPVDDCIAPTSSLTPSRERMKTEMRAKSHEYPRSPFDEQRNPQARRKEKNPYCGGTSSKLRGQQEDSAWLGVLSARRVGYFEVTGSFKTVFKCLAVDVAEAPGCTSQKDWGGVAVCCTHLVAGV